MGNLLNKIIADRGGLEDIMSRIPGFRGYVDKSSRREADRMIRNHVEGLFQAVKNRFELAEGDLVRAGGLAYMDKTKTIKEKIEVLRRRIATDTPGYSGFFASNKIGPDELEKVYAFDSAMTDYSDRLSLAVDAFVTAVNANEGIAEALTQVDRVIIEADEAYHLRDKILTGLA